MKKNEREVKPRLLPDKITKKLLLSLPKRDWSKVSIYDQIYLVPEGGKHDSGFMFIAIIGVSKREFKNKSKFFHWRKSDDFRFLAHVINIDGDILRI